jgi:hypothetical protein
MTDRGHEPGGNRVTNGHEDDGDGAGRVLGGQRQLFAERTNHVDAALDQLRRLGHGGLGFAARETNLVHDVPALLAAERLETGLETLHGRNDRDERGMQHTDPKWTSRRWLAERERRRAGQEHQCNRKRDAETSPAHRPLTILPLGAHAQSLAARQRLTRAPDKR